jgi:formylglycine-generating enzyme required for sulfatase activity
MTFYVFDTGYSYVEYLKELRNSQPEGNATPQVILEIPKSLLDQIADEKSLVENNLQLESIVTRLIDNKEVDYCCIVSNPPEIKTKYAEIPADFHWGFADRIIHSGHFHDDVNQIFPQPEKPDHIEAFGFFAKALDSFNKKDYVSAADFLKTAISGNATFKGYKNEWRFHFLAGIIHLGFYGCNTDLVDLGAAEKEFIQAGKYALADYPIESSIALLAASWAAYCRGKSDDTQKYTSEALNLNCKLSEAHYLKGKNLLSAGNISEAMQELYLALDSDVFYALKAAADCSYNVYESELKETLINWKADRLNSFRSEVAEDVAALNASSINNDLKGVLDIFSKDRFLLDMKRVEQEWSKFKTIPVFVSKPVEKLKIELETLVKVVEPYKEKVVIREKTWFRKEEAKIVAKTRVVEKMKKMRYEVSILRDMFMFFTGKVLVEFDMVQVDSGKFKMGDTAGVGRADELPIREIDLTTYLISKIPVTQKLWNLVMDTNPSNFHGYDLPVEHISWYDAIDFCNKLSILAGFTPCYNIDKSVKDPNNLNKTDSKRLVVTCDWDATGYRLPTEAEWEYAAKGGDNSNYYNFAGGDSEGPVCWHKNNSQYKTQNVGQKKPNELGLHDMSGNVWEWCWDWYEEYIEGHYENPRGAETGNYRVLRGGSWADNLNYQRVSSRGKENPTGRYSSIGLRVVRKT